MPSKSKMRIIPLPLAEANAFVSEHHRHHKPVRAHKFSMGAVKDGKIVGVCIVSRPVARMKDDGFTMEVSRLCTDGTRNACSFLYSKAAKACFAMGYTKVGTYTLPEEGGVSLRASGWKFIKVTQGDRSWSCPSRPRVDKHPLQGKLSWETENPEHPHDKEEGKFAEKGKKFTF